jgi:hypothetical protein
MTPIVKETLQDIACIVLCAVFVLILLIFL